MLGHLFTKTHRHHTDVQSLLSCLPYLWSIPMTGRQRNVSERKGSLWAGEYRRRREMTCAWRVRVFQRKRVSLVDRRVCINYLLQTNKSLLNQHKLALPPLCGGRNLQLAWSGCGSGHLRSLCSDCGLSCVVLKTRGGAVS